MKSHDVLKISVFADSEQIENAYSVQMNALIKNGYDKTYPNLYSRKVNELKKAKEECLKYISAPIMKKAELEIQDCADKAYSPNVLHSWCWAGDTCGNCCLVVFCIALSAAGLSVLGVLIGIGTEIHAKVKEVQNKHEAKRRNDEMERLKRRHNEEIELLLSLDPEYQELESTAKQAERKQKELNTQLDEFELYMNLVCSFLEKSGTPIDLRETNGYKEIYNKTINTKNELNRYHGRLKEIDAIRDTISQHEHEREDFRNQGR